MKTLKGIAVLVAAAVLAASCGFFGAFNNPVDPLSEAYQGYMSVSFTDIAVNTYHVLAAGAAGAAWAWGSNGSGQLGYGRTGGYVYRPGEVKDLTGIQSVAAGYEHSLAVDESGGLWGWGSNVYHQLGTAAGGGILPEALYDEPVRLRDGILAADGGSYFSAAIDTTGLVSVWGAINTVSDTADFDSAVPEALPLPGGRTAVDLVCGSNHMVVLADDGTVWEWGYYGDSMHEVYRQVTGMGTVECLGGTNLAAETGGTLWTWVTGGTGLERIPITASGFSSLASGYDFTLALTDGGELYGWGSNDLGRLGLPYWIFSLEEPCRIDAKYEGFDFTGAKVFAGDVNSFLLLADGSLFSWGGNNYGKLGVGKEFAPTRNLDRFVVDFGSPDVTVTHAYGAGGCGFALDGEGSVWTWGNNDDGRLGLGDTTFRVEPEIIPGLSGCAALSAGYGFAAALDEAGTLWGWGDNEYGQLGTGDTADSAVPVSMLASVTAFDCGSYHIMAVQNDGTVRSWGYNGYGQLGTGDTTTRKSPAQVFGIDAGITAVACGDLHSLALDVNGNIWSWGHNSYGELGDGSTDDRTTPEMLPSDLFEGQSVAFIEAGNSGSFAVTADGSLWSWGRGFGGYDTGSGPFPQKILEGITVVAVSYTPGYDWQNLLILAEDGTVYYADISSVLMAYEFDTAIEDVSGNNTSMYRSDLWSGRNLTRIEGGYGHFFLADGSGVLYAF